MNKYSNEKDEIDRRKQCYGCSGVCYWDSYIEENGEEHSGGMCGAAGICPETCTDEFIATCIGCLAIMIIYLLPFLLIIYLILK